MFSPLNDRYLAMLASGEVQPDPAQQAVMLRLAELATRLASHRRGARSVLGRLFGRKRAPPPGLYIHGKVGRGKTMLMDLFFDTVAWQPKRRLHFHEFMAETHDRIGEVRKRVDGDPIPHVAAEIAQDCSLLCFDEMHVTDIADAMILGRLFAGLFQHEVVVVATSNMAPAELYRNGLNRELFLPSIALIEAHMEVVELSAAKDYRLEKLEGQPLWFQPLGPAAQTALDAAFRRLTGVCVGKPLELDVKGRSLTVPQAAAGVARFSFEELCDRPLGSLDYLHLAHRFHTLVLDEIPRLLPERRAATRRFVNLIDTLYDNRVGLIASAAAEPDRLYPEGDQSVLFERTASRLIEMRTPAYLQSRLQRATDINRGPAGPLPLGVG